MCLCLDERWFVWRERELVGGRKWCLCLVESLRGEGEVRVEAMRVTMRISEMTMMMMNEISVEFLFSCLCGCDIFFQVMDFMVVIIVTYYLLVGASIIFSLI